MIQIKYIPLFEIEILHDYYADKLCRDISIVPTVECKTALQKTGLRFLATETGCKIFARVNEIGGKDILQLPMSENLRLNFLMILRNNAFKTFTQLELNTERNLQYYFNNLEENSGTDNTVHLVSNKFGKKLSNGDLKIFRTGTYQYISNTAIPESDVRISYTDSTEQMQQLLDPVNGNTRKIFSFDLKKGSAGRAELLEQGNSKDSFYIMSSADRQDIFGVIEMFHRSSLPAKNKFVNESDNSIAAKKYLIQFANRQTTWRYHVNKKFNKDITAISIKKENGTAIEFESAPGSTQELFIKTSKNPIPLTETAVTGIKLLDNLNQEIIAHLPNASLQVLKEEGGKHFSDIFITI